MRTAIVNFFILQMACDIFFTDFYITFSSTFSDREKYILLLENIISNFFVNNCMKCWQCNKLDFTFNYIKFDGN